MRLFVWVLAGALSAGMAQTSGPAGVYGYINKVVAEPNAGAPERMQVWGVFSVAAPGLDNEYQEPENGYLYFELAGDSSAAIGEFQKLKGVIGKMGVAAFSRPGERVRVRTSDEKPDHPDPYRCGNGVAVVGFDTNSPAVRMLGRLTKTRGQVGYALVDRVLAQPNAGTPERIQVWGVFAMGERSGEAWYAAPRQGYLYLAIPPGVGTAAWSEWEAVAGKRQVVRFEIPPWARVRLRGREERAETPDTYQMRGPYMVRADTEYAPVRAVLQFR
jgi:hypothetical protein